MNIQHHFQTVSNTSIASSTKNLENGIEQQCSDFQDSLSDNTTILIIADLLKLVNVSNMGLMSPMRLKVTNVSRIWPIEFFTRCEIFETTSFDIRNHLPELACSDSGAS